MSDKRILIFGGSGTIGSACAFEFQTLGVDTVIFGRDLSGLDTIGKIDGVVWAQGENSTERFLEISDETWTSIFDANFHFIVRSLSILLRSNLIGNGARLVVISSIWQEITRPNKVAYISSKAAVGGLVRGLASDLGADGIAINAILPGVVRSPMTDRNLSPHQITAIEEDTPSRALIRPEDIAKVVAFLIDKDSIGINGQSIVVDGGWSITRHV